MDKDKAIERTSHLSKINREVLISLAKKNDHLEMAVLVISALTAGGLWVMIGASFENIAAWLGAVLSTLVAGITLYQKKEQGPKHGLAKAIELQEQIDSELVALRYDDERSMRDHDANYKVMVGEAIRLKYKGRDLSSLTPEERQEYEQSFGQ